MNQEAELFQEMGRAISRMSLYPAEHSLVRESVKASSNLLRSLLDERKEVSLGFSEGKLLSDGVMLEVTPTALSLFASLFARFKIDSFTFITGVTETELISFYQLLSFRPESPSAASLKATLEKKGIQYVRVNEAYFTRVASKEEVGKTGGSGRLGVEGEGVAGGSWLDQAATLKPEEAIAELIKRSGVSGPEGERLKEAVLGHIAREAEAKVAQATQTIRREKTELTNTVQRTQAVISNVADGVVVDDEGRVLTMNPAAEKIYGMKLSEQLGKPLSANLKEERMTVLAKELSTPADRPLETEMQVRSSEDTLRTLRASSARVENDQGKVVGMVSVLPDVTKQKELNQLESDILSTVTHELRSPATAIKASLGILAAGTAGPVSQDQEKIVSTASKNAERMLRLINDLLDLSRFESGRTTLEPRPCDLGALVRDAVESVLHWAKSRNVRLEQRVSSSLPLVSVDPDRILQVVVNLLSNAIKFTPSGGQVWVEVAREGTDPSTPLRAGGESLKVLVRDTGPGISRKDIARIFEKFVQLTSKVDVKGSGLGLSIARAIVRLHRSDLLVESEEGKGSSFYFSLPALKETPKPAGDQAPGAAPPVRPTFAKKVSAWFKSLRTRRQPS